MDLRFPPDALDDMLRRAYGIEPLRIAPHKSGWSAAAHLVEAADGARYFLKAYDKRLSSTAQWTAHIDAYVPVLLWLEEGPLRGRLPRPLRTLDGACSAEDERGIYLLSHYLPGDSLDAAPLSEAQAREMAWMLAQIHRWGEREPALSALPREDYAVPFCDGIREYFRERPVAPQALADLLGAHEPLLLDLTERTERSAARLRAASPARVLCHTDAHGWNTVVNDRVCLIDWEGARLAPPEADLFLFAEGAGWDGFLGAYRAARGGYEMDADAMAFYLARRRIEDIWADVERILHGEDADGASMALLVRQLAEMAGR